MDLVVLRWVLVLSWHTWHDDNDDVMFIDVDYTISVRFIFGGGYTFVIVCVGGIL